MSPLLHGLPATLAASPRHPSHRTTCSLALAAALSAGLWLPAHAHDDAANKRANIEVCASATHFSALSATHLNAPYNNAAAQATLLKSPLGQSVLAHLWVNADTAQPCFAISDTPIWGPVVSRIPADVVALSVNQGLDHALVYVTGLPDYTIETPALFTGFKPGNIYGVYKLSAQPQADTRSVHTYARIGAVGFFVNGSSIFNYSDSFSYQDKGAWIYNANVAEASIVNSDIAHATPSNLPQFPQSRGVFHNHQMSREVMKQLDDPFARGVLEHSKVIGYAIDSYPIYGPIGYTSADASSGLKILRSSYVKRDWMGKDQGGTDHRSSLPGWVVRGWDTQYTGDTLLNFFGKAKADLLLADPGKTGPVTYTGSDGRLSEEIHQLSKTRTLHRDESGYVYWEADIALPAGGSAVVRNYLLKSSDLWAANLGEQILPVSYQAADPDKFRFAAVTGSFAEDYEYVPGYGDLDFYNGIESFVPERNQAVYRYVTPYDTTLDDSDRLSKTTFPYFIGIQYKGVIDTFNRADQAEKNKGTYLADNQAQYQTVFDLGIVGKDENNAITQGSVIETWRDVLSASTLDGSTVGQ